MTLGRGKALVEGVWAALAGRIRPAEPARREPPIPAGCVRMYHGTPGADGHPADAGGARWFSSQRSYARDYRGGGEAGLWYVDVPRSDQMFDAEYDNQTVDQGFTVLAQFDPALYGGARRVVPLRSGSGAAAALATAVLLGLAAAPVEARNFGSYGQLFPVEEPDILETILSRLRAAEASGGLARMEEDFQGRARDYIERPSGGVALPPAEEYRAFEFDPSIVVERDLADHRGVVFARAGSRVNPLDYSGFSKRIVVIDGDAPAQVAFALAEGDELDTLIVMAKGAPLDLGRRHGRRFWVDQQGVILGRFGVERLPTVITRQDPVFLVEEIPLEEASQ